MASAGFEKVIDFHTGGPARMLQPCRLVLRLTISSVLRLLWPRAAADITVAARPGRCHNCELYDAGVAVFTQRSLVSLGS